MRSPATAGAFDPLTPNWPRIRHYLTGGKDHFPSDRAAADRLQEILPSITAVLREQHEFTDRALHHLITEDGITQILELGCGFPRPRNVHEIALALTPDARTVYASDDPMVLAHARALLTADGTSMTVARELHAPQTVLKDPDVQGFLDLDQPVAVLLADVLHFTDDPAGVVAAIGEHLAPGSTLVISHLCLDGLAPAAAKAIVRVLADTDTPITPRTSGQIRALLAGLDITAPGLVPVARWRPEHDLHHPTPQILGAVATWPGGRP
ncbi:SAM-dependent methyltransferase [Planomonospora alba]|uniref:SAM-dependent methyltransferase n=1 Tax=Planomonospora alba TaxID=161354 RepID=A0ABP6NE92_9ACTN